MPSPFIHLHTHSHYSLLEALPKVKKLIAHVQKLEQDAVAVTDNGTLYGAIEFYQKATEAGVKPIIGMDAYIGKDGRAQKRHRIDSRPNRLVLLAENNEGYRNLVILSSIGFLEGFYYKPRIDHEVLRLHSKGLIALSGGHMGEIEEMLNIHDRTRAEALAKTYVEIFGEGNFFLELVDRPEIPEQEAVNAQLIEMGKALNIPVVATKSTLYLKPSDVEAWKVLNCIKGGKTLEDFDRLSQYEYDASMVSTAYMIERFKDVPEAIENTRKIADRCNVTMDLGKWNFADFKIPEGKTFLDVLRERAFEEIKGKVKVVDQVVIDRINYELSVIDAKGFAPYFLIVSDYIEWSRRNGIVTTTRGSAAGSLVSFAIGISTVDPLHYKLPFERFLNPERPSAPDVDADFADNRRDEVLEYVRSKYGADRVAQICTFGTMLARGSVRDVGRALGEPLTFVDQLAKMVPMGSQGFPMTLDRALLETPDLKRLYDTNTSARRVIDLARQIEGCARHVSIHAAGTVISPTALTDFTPLQIDTREGKVITQYEMKAVEAAGLLKMDFLGIRNLSILGDAIALVKKTKGVNIVLETIPVEDAKTFELLANGFTMGTFQLNGDGMTKYLMELKPTRIEDIMVMVALYRPGPIESIPEYIRRKRDPKLITYLDPRMKEIIEGSYGVIVYQDDVMLTAIKLGGYSWLDADKLRKAMGKKIPEEMAAQKEKLLKGFLTNGLSEKKGQELWKLIEPFAAYGFNKCLTGDTRVMNPKTGAYQTLAELFEKGSKGNVVALKSNFTLSAETRSVVVQNGVKPVFEIRTRSGRSIRATANHPFLKMEGWTRVDGLSTGDRIAVARSLPPGSGTDEDIRRWRVLGYLIAEGNLCHPHGVYYYSTQEDEIADFIRAVAVFKNTKVTIDRSKSTAAVYIGQADQKKGNTLRLWLDDLGLMGKTATEKMLPDIVYRLDEQELIELISAMWQGDGCVHPDKGGQIFYATSSKELASQLQHLLLRIGICSTIHTKSFRYRGGHKVGYTVHVSSCEQVERFAVTIGRRLLPRKRKALESIVRRLEKAYAGREGVIARGTKDIVPVEVYKLLRAEMGARNMTPTEVSKVTGLAVRLFAYDARRIGYTRSVLARIATVLKFKDLHDLAQSDVYWDEIVSITPSGKEMTYDLEVPGSHNFVANDIVVHNSHAASYGMIAYDTAYMKANYPAEYMTSLMTAESADLETIALAVHECNRMGIEVLAPDLNESLANFTYVDDTHIRFGLVAIKGMGEEVVDCIITERKARGPFKDLADVARRIEHRAFNKKSLDVLIRTGALDRFGERAQLLENMDRILMLNKTAAREREASQVSLFAGAPSISSSPLTLKEAPPAPMREILAWEKDLLGLYVSSHPFNDIAKALEGLILPCIELANAKEADNVRVGGVISTVKPILTKKGDEMAFVGLEDRVGKIEVIVFPRTYAEFKHVIVPDSILIVSGKVSRKGNKKPVKGADGEEIESETVEEAKLLANSFMAVKEGEAEGVAELLRNGGWIPEGMKGMEGVEGMGMEEVVAKKTRAVFGGGEIEVKPAVIHRGTLSIALKGRPNQETIAALRETLKASPGIERVCFLVESAGTYRKVETDYTVSISDELVTELASLVGRENVVRETV